MCKKRMFPTPSTAFYEEMKSKGLLLEQNWSVYKKFDRMIFRHDRYTSWEEFQESWAWLEFHIAQSLAWKRLFRRNGQPFPLKVMNVVKANPKLKRVMQRLPVIGTVGTEVSRRLQHRYDPANAGVSSDAAYAG